MLNQLTHWLQSADTTGLLTFLATLLLTGYRLLHPLIQAKLQTIHNTQKLQALKLADELAGVIIPELAKLTELEPQQRKAEAIQFINQHLKTLGLSLTDETIAAKVEQAYYNYRRPPNQS
ncbi:hypothetical protein ABC628_11775 [Lentilactobacillus otakiensis]|uniref:Phage holin, LL-H family n=1 Tax=Lentilactobacillus otakiensis DSM 19908 = JCM 15040 TaxID=1423780 RepID=S4NPM0_9LACO|nr:hypothetical protein [Lentilactobacillus otakiensis]KRL10508.1 hypothetical protein FD05_GL000638 [Lentilactobacillus otakiensis DSM 19908 = JCM 15040]MBZ3775914.1 hypothetical protein [Lentilactobacillus otakiensis]GAD17751.1 hypothetical protein LOT_2289 [Lentilactobacillus otakiensis DSM 19908 = JCM 15040]